MNLQLKINVKATLHKYDLLTAKKKYKQAAPAEPTDLEAFIKAEKHIEVDDPQIQQAAERIKAKSDLDTVKKIYSYVLKNMKYSAKLEEVGAVKSLEKKRGNCMGYAQLFTALCRAKKIPSRVIEGYVSQYDIVPQHAWVEVYLKEFGWVPFDPTYGDANEKSAQSKRFFNLSPIYIYVNYTGADEMLVECGSKAGLLFGDVTIKDSVVFR